MEMEAFKVRFCCLQTAEQETRRFCSGRRDLQPPTRPLRIIIFDLANNDFLPDWQLKKNEGTRPSSRLPAVSLSHNVVV
jgi:hypothetical protein